MSEYNPVKRVNELEQILCNLISYILWLYEKKYISERTKNELLKIINPNMMKGGEENVFRRNKIN